MSTQAYCHFCDDIRYEVGNKNSLIGLYSSELFVEQIPIAIPKLCVIAFISAPLDNPMTSLTLKVILGDEVLSETRVPDEFIKETVSSIRAKSTPTDEYTKILIGVNTILCPLLLDREGVLKVVAIADSTEIVAGKLRIKLSEDKK